jgi:plasmid stabilization system protein ParE
MSANARAYLRDEAKYLRQRSPELGFATDGLPIPGMRRLIVGNYLLDYEISGEVVLVVAIRHGRQTPSELTLDDDFDFEQRD